MNRARWFCSTLHRSILRHRAGTCLFAGFLATQSPTCYVRSPPPKPSPLLVKGIAAIAGAAAERALDHPRAGENQPPLIVMPAQLDFGDVAINAESQQAVVISNPTAFALTATSAHIIGAGFSLSSSSPMPVTIAAHGRVDLVVVFRPLTNGRRSGVLVIEIDSLLSRFIRVALRGRGRR